MVEDAIITTIKKYLASLPDFGIHACRAVLFGSYALGKAHEYSDIDLIVIAPEFDGSREISLVKALWQATVADNRIEPIPCGEQEWETDGGRVVLEIARREGVVITA
jgi:predicted nucleotidyltransferase